MPSGKIDPGGTTRAGPAQSGADRSVPGYPATSELINAGVFIEAVRRRLGHVSTETTRLYTLLNDDVADADADAEIRAARRRRDRAGR
ncbi:hypothetical protein ACIBLB_19710 [Streptosporangium canum]|uniref:hypothetical protein n=1 Tax=Streptosporangium canum TaxID=324952 RepID=UPI0037876FE8